ncbi:MAG: DUF2092 domain-containing protein [Gammaproteobacteria bacterium]
MKLRTQLATTAVAVLLASTTHAQEASVDTSEMDEIDPVVLGILKQAADFLVAEKTFGFKSETSYDAIQEDGTSVEFGGSRRVLVARPDRLRIETQKRSGDKGLLLFDGENMWGYSPEQKAYATTAQVGDLDESLDFTVSVLRIKAPLADLLSPQLYETMTDGLVGALYVGQSVVMGTPSHHLLISNDYVDVQLWVAEGDQPLIQRIVITYREEQGQPQFRAQFLKWEMSPGNVESELKFSPPEDSERIRFHVPASAADEEDAS